MRKVLSFVLVLSLVLGSFGMAFAAPLSDMAGEKSEDAVNVLTQLGVVSGYPDGTYKPDNIVTRAEMAVIVVRALGLADYAIGTANFSDMGGHWSNPYVAYAASLGIIAGYPDGTFRPDKTVSYDEAATMLVAALGYNADSLTGTWPANFVVKAKSLGILDGIKAGSAGANRGDIAIMAFQALDAKIGSTDKDGKWTANDPEDTMLSRLGAELYEPDGFDAEDPDYAFVLTKAIADDAVANVKAYLGAYVTAYANSDNEIIAIKDVKSTFLTGEFDITSATTVSALATEVFEAEKDYDVRTVGSLTEFFNNGADSDPYQVEKDVTYKLAAKVSGVKIDAIYSVSLWEVTESDLFDDDYAEEIADDQTLMGLEFVLDDDDEIDLTSFELVGVASLDDIDEDNVVYVYAGLVDGDTVITKIEVGTEVVKGEVTRIKSGAYTIDGKAYDLSDEFSGDAPKLGDEIEAYLDVNGDIYDYELLAGSADDYAVVLEAYSGNNPGTLGGTDAQVKLFLADGTTKVFVVDTDEVDAWVFTSGTAITTGDVVKYAVNKDGEITDIVSVVDVSAGGSASYEMTAKGYLNGFAVNSDAVVFTYDDTFTTDKADYSVSKVADLLDSDLTGVWYTLTDASKINFIYVNAQSTTGGDDVFAVITGYEENNSDGGWGVDLLVDGSAVYYDANKKLDYAKNVLYVVKFALDGTVDDLQTWTAYKVGKSAGTDYNEITSITTAAAISGKVVTYNDDVKITLDDNAVVYKPNGDATKFVKGSLSDIKGKTNLNFLDVDGDKIYDIVLVTFSIS